MMNTYVALLRGINVGGNNTIAMTALKECFEKADCTNVTTYINSGNIIFSHPAATSLDDKLEAAIAATFGLHIKVLLKTKAEFALIADALPDTWTNDKNMKSDVLFAWDTTIADELLNVCPPKKGIDAVIALTDTVLWSVKRQDVSKSSLASLVGTKTYKRVTVRNVNTTRKIWQLLQTI